METKDIKWKWRVNEWRWRFGRLDWWRRRRHGDRIIYGYKPFTSNRCGSLSLTIYPANWKKPSKRCNQYECPCPWIVTDLRDPVGESTAARKMVFRISGAIKKLRQERHVDERLTIADTEQCARTSRRISSGRTSKKCLWGRAWSNRLYSVTLIEEGVGHL